MYKHKIDFKPRIKIRKKKCFHVNEPIGLSLFSLMRSTLFGHQFDKQEYVNSIRNFEHFNFKSQHFGIGNREICRFR